MERTPIEKMLNLIGHPVTDAEIDRRLDLHTPQDQATRDLLDDLRARFKALYRHVRDVTPVCREQSLAFTHLEDALQVAIAAVVRPRPLPRTCAEAGDRCKRQCTVNTDGVILDPDCFR